MTSEIKRDSERQTLIRGFGNKLIVTHNTIVDRVYPLPSWVKPLEIEESHAVVVERSYQGGYLVTRNTRLNPSAILPLPPFAKKKIPEE